MIAYRRAGDPAAAAASAAVAESVALCQTLGDDVGLARALNVSGNIALARGELAAARAHYVKAESLFRRLEDASGLAAVTGNLAYVALLKGDDAALELAERAVITSREAGTTPPTATNLLTLAFAHLQRRNTDAAVAATREAAQVARWLDHREALAYCVEAFGAIAAVRNASEEAVRLLGAAAAAREALNVRLDAFEARIDNEARATVRASIPAELFATAWGLGSTLTLDEALAEALDTS